MNKGQKLAELANIAKEIIFSHPLLAGAIRDSCTSSFERFTFDAVESDRFDGERAGKIVTAIHMFLYPYREFVYKNEAPPIVAHLVQFLPPADLDKLFKISNEVLRTIEPIAIKEGWK